MIPLDCILRDKALFRHAVAQLTPEILGSVIDNTLLDPYATRTDIKRLVEDSNEIGSFVCVNSSRIQHIRDLEPDNIRGIATVISFPYGADDTDAKCGAIDACVRNGADEIDVVANIGFMRDLNYTRYRDELMQLALFVSRLNISHNKAIVLKIIQENCTLSVGQRKLATKIIADAAEETGARVFAKTSTGYGTPLNEDTPIGATVEDVYMMCEIVRPYQKRGVRIGIKAAGGIKTAKQAILMMLAGGCFDDNGFLRRCDRLPDIFRIGSSSGATLVDDYSETFDPPF